MKAAMTIPTTNAPLICHPEERSDEGYAFMRVAEDQQDVLCSARFGDIGCPTVLLWESAPSPIDTSHGRAVEHQAMFYSSNTTLNVILRSGATKDLLLLLIVARKQRIPHPDIKRSGFGMTRKRVVPQRNRNLCHPEERSDEGYAFVLDCEFNEELHICV
ncbi:MAG: hypothetical protein AB1752_04605 [Candidatus Zixiibacteriota bacterium]